MNSHNKRIRFIYLSFVTSYIVLLISSLTLSEKLSSVYNDRIIKTFLGISGNDLIIGNYREVKTAYDRTLALQFHEMDIFSPEHKLIYRVSKDVSTADSMFERTTNYDLTNGGYVVFKWSNILEYLVALGIWMLLLLIGLLFLRRNLNALKKGYENELILNRAELFQSIAVQVSHDIRSPLGALEMISSSNKEIPKDLLLIIRNSVNRIRDIANDLVESKKKPFADISEFNLASNSVELENTHFAPLIGSIIDEKRVKYQISKQIKFDFVQEVNSGDLLGKVNPVDLKRVLSNLLDNAVEALKNKSGNVSVSLGVSPRDNANIEIIVKDNGSGIPAIILPKLFEKGATFGKQDGSGLGLFHAKQAIEAMRGTLTLSSIEGDGTLVTISLPRFEIEDHIVHEIKLKPQSHLIIVDDDKLMHEAWKMKLKGISALKISHFYSPREFMNYMRTNFGEQDNSLFLIDFEFKNDEVDGIELIRSFGIHNQSYLVTGRSGDRLVIEECKKQGIKLIPKTEIANISFKFEQ